MANEFVMTTLLPVLIDVIDMLDSLMALLLNGTSCRSGEPWSYSESSGSRGLRLRVETAC